MPRWGQRLFKFLAERSEKGPILRKLREQMFKAATQLLDADNFFSRLREDIKNANAYVAIVSPFLRRGAVKRFLSYDEVQKQLNNVKFIVLTRKTSDIKEEKSRKEHEDCIKMLQESGIYVFEREKLHFKAVIIDDEILYIGSINPLSIMVITYLPEDYMLRFTSEVLVDEVLDNAIKREEFEKYLSAE